MDRDLELVARGDAVGKETADAATMVLSRGERRNRSDAGRDAGARTRRRLAASATARTTRRSARGRSIWPWLIGLGLALALAAGGYFVYQKIQDQLDKSKPVRVEQYTGLKLENAKALVKKRRLRAAGRAASRTPTSPIGIVFKQDPIEGTNLGRGSPVTLTVSTGKPKVPVPGVVGKSLADAVAALTEREAGGEPPERAFRPAGRHGDRAGSEGGHRRRREARRVRINVSKGPKQVFLPSRRRPHLRPGRPRSCRPPASPCAGSTSTPTSRRTRSSTRPRPGTRS